MALVSSLLASHVDGLTRRVQQFRHCLHAATVACRVHIDGHLLLVRRLECAVVLLDIAVLARDEAEKYVSSLFATDRNKHFLTFCATSSRGT